MKYFVYSYLWKRKGETNWERGSDLFAGSATELYEFAARQPEQWCLTSVTEICETEYEVSNRRGILG